MAPTTLMSLGRSQPDWYIGFMEGSLRLMPGVATNLDGHMFVWNVFIPAVFLPLPSSSSCICTRSSSNG